MRKGLLVAMAALGGLVGGGLGLFRARRRLIARALTLPPPLYPVGVEKDLQVPAEAGRLLLANHYFPKASGDFPTILIRSPWGRGLEAPPFSILYWLIAGLFAERGYHVVVQNTRVRSNDEGELFPWGEREDGSAALEWIGKQPWFNDHLGMWGASYMGYSQWAVAADAPDYLRALVPATCSSNWYSFFYQDGALALERVLTTLAMIRSAGLPLRELIGGSKNREAAYQAATHHLPLAVADRVLTGEPVSSWRDTLAHPDAGDPFWQPLTHRDSLPRVRAAVHLVGGWYDVFLRETLADYQALVDSGASPYLTIGPYTHTAPEGGWESLRQGLAWFEAALKGRREPLRASRVRVYVMGANKWMEFPGWPPITVEKCFALQGDGSLITQELAADTHPAHFTYDPSNPTPAIGGSLIGAGAGAVDDAHLESRADVLIYDMTVAADLSVIGAPRLDLYARSTAPSADFFARLCDVTTDGLSLNVCDGLTRRLPGAEGRLADGSYTVRIELGPTAYRFPAGHRLRLVLAGGAHPRWNRNPGTGDTSEISVELCAVEETVYHDREHPSLLTLPVVTGD